MTGYRPDIRASASEVIRHLPPDIKRAVRAAIRLLAANPAAGEPLQEELAGRSKYRVRRFRIIYRLDRTQRILHIIAVGHRRRVYEELARSEEPEA